MDSYQELANAIVLQAIRDYRLSEGKQKLTSIERFFYSDWFGVLTNINPDMLVIKLRKGKLHNGY